MLIQKTPNGKFYGKIGSGNIFNGKEKYSIGWFIGYVITGQKKYSFACVLKGENILGKDARAIIEKILIKNKML